MLSPQKKCPFPVSSGTSSISKGDTVSFCNGSILIGPGETSKSDFLILIIKQLFKYYYSNEDGVGCDLLGFNGISNFVSYLVPKLSVQKDQSYAI